MLSPTEQLSLELAGFALAEGIARASAGRTVHATLVVRQVGHFRCIPLGTTLPARTQAAVVLDAVGESVACAAVLRAHHLGVQRTLKVSAWVQGSWRYEIALPFKPGARLHVEPERIEAAGGLPAEVLLARDAVYSGVSVHPDGLRAWAAAVVDV